VSDYRQIDYNLAMKNLSAIIAVCVALLLLTGIAVVLLVDPGQPDASNLEPPPSLSWHMASIATGLALVLMVMRWQPSSLRAWSPAILILAASLLLVEIFLGRSSENPAWLATMLPLSRLSEWTKLAVVLSVPAALQGKPTYPGWLANRMPAFLGFVVAGLVMLTFRGLSIPYVLTLTLTALVVVLLSGRYRRHALGVFALVLSGVLWNLLDRPYILPRLSTYLFSPNGARSWSLPERALAPASSFRSDPGGYDMITTCPSLSANEWVVATLVSLFDWSGLYIVLLLLFVLVVSCFLVSRRARDEYDRLLGMGITTLVCFQIVFHGAVVTGHIGAMGVALPFVSAEGYSMVMFLVCMGLMMGIARRSTPTDNIVFPSRGPGDTST
jgi:cell division protein FtsW (lipid II flippase)